MRNNRSEYTANLALVQAVRVAAPATLQARRRNAEFQRECVAGLRKLQLLSAGLMGLVLVACAL
jgi:hypothetical protein